MYLTGPFAVRQLVHHCNLSSHLYRHSVLMVGQLCRPLWPFRKKERTKRKLSVLAAAVFKDLAQ